MSAAVPTVIGLGRLLELIIRNAQGQRLRISPHGDQWLGWKPDSRDLVVLRPRRGQGQVAKRRDAKGHWTFHGAAPLQARPMEWPAPQGAVRSLGLIESVSYTAADIASPSKGSHCWIHQFGDRGERGHRGIRSGTSSPYAESVMPRLDVDAEGHLMIVRRASNTFTVRDWILA